MSLPLMQTNRKSYTYFLLVSYAYQHTVKTGQELAACE